MRLLLVSRPFVFHGGVETATAGLVGALVEHGYEVHLLSPRAQQPVPGTTLHALPWPTLPPFGRLGRVLALVAGTTLVARRRSWDVVQSHERTLAQDVYRAGEGCHRAYVASRDGGRPVTTYDRLVLALEKRVFARTPELVAIARVGRAEITRLYGVPAERVSVVYNGVDLTRFHPERAERLRGPARSEVGIAGDAWVSLFLGSGFERKGLATVIEALARFEEPSRRLIVVGKGDVVPYRALAERLGLGARVVWLGARPDPERWFAAADMVVLPSRYEPFGNVHLEALASGVPVVASARAGGAEVVADGRNGAVVDPEDAAAVAEALARVRAIPRTDVVGACRRAAEPFTYAAQVAGFGDVYRRRLSARADFP